MKYYLIAGEASGDLHASKLMEALKEEDPEAEFRFVGGDLMAACGGTCVKHYKEIAYMGFIPVLTHARTILRSMAHCKKDVLRYRPDCLILIDYPGFNLSIAQYVKARSGIPVYYYISPKIWAWKEHRIKNIKRDIDELFSILPFETGFYRKHGYPIHYTGNPTRDETAEFLARYAEDFPSFCARNGLEERPILALLAGSRKQELKDNLPRMLEAAGKFPAYQCVVAGAPGLTPGDYMPYLRPKKGNPPASRPAILYGETYPLLFHSTAAMVTSGTATLESALLRCPQVVCYYAPLGPLVRLLRKMFLKVKYISLVNLIGGREIVKELVADEATPARIAAETALLLPGQPRRKEMLEGYEEVTRALGQPGAARHTARALLHCLGQRKAGIR